ncbi:MAG: nucleotidyltransferase domain-containing protein [Vulcanimicrobiota bacterium]
MSLALQVGRRFRQRLEALLGEHLVELRLFGSRVRGDAHAESDLDVFVLVDSDEAAWLAPVVGEASALLLEMELPFALCPLVMDVEHYGDLKDREVRLARDLETEGVPI